MKLVIKVGGSLSFGEDGPIMEYFRKLLPVLERIKSENQVIISIGGGKFVRKYYESLKESCLTDEEKEWIGVDLLRANVRFASFILGMGPLFSLDEIDKNTSGVIGGIKPGRSTDANAALAAEKIGADLIIKLTNVDGVYDSDPNKNKDARKIEKIAFDDAMKYATDGKPGDYGVFDKTAVEVISRNRIKTFIIDGTEPNNILKLLKGDAIGTVIC